MLFLDNNKTIYLISLDLPKLFFPYNDGTQPWFFSRARKLEDASNSLK